MDAQELGSGIVAHQRKARFAGVSSEEWARRLTELIAAQPEVTGPVEVANVRPVAAAAGGSNGTMLFDARYTEGGKPLERALVLRFLPASGLFKHYDVRGQFALQQALTPTKVPVPRQLWLDEESRFLKAPGYVMEQVAGVSTPMSWKASGLLVDASPADRRRMTEAYVHTLVNIHDVDWKSAGLQWLEQRAAGTRPIERETNWYWDSLVWAEVEDYVDQLAPVREWLIANEPKDVEVVLCHGDANLGNYLFDNAELTAVVDWEMAFLGTRECDATFIKVGDENLQGHIPAPEGALTYEEIYAEYERVSGYKLRDLPYFEMFTSYRGAVISVLAMKHFPAEVLADFMPFMKRGVTLCLDRGRSLGIAC